MRIVAVSPTAVVSGAERVLFDYMAAARAEGWHVTVAAPVGPMTELVSDAGIDVAEIPELKLGDGGRVRAVGEATAASRRAARVLRQLAAGADVVLANSLLALPAVGFARIDTPVCWLVHDVIVRRDRRLLARATARVVDLAVAVSDASADLSRRLGTPTVVVRNGVAWPVSPHRETHSPPRVGVNAVLTPWKGQDVFLEALSMIERPVVGVLLGAAMPKDGEYVARLRRRSEAPDLSGRVVFCGHRDDPLDVMRDWSVAVSSSVDPEAGPLAVLEAMSLGLPTVVTDHGGAPEVVRGMGRIVAPGDPEAMAVAISAYLDDPEGRRHDGDRSRAAVACLYTKQRAVDRFLEVVAAL